MASNVATSTSTSTSTAERYRATIDSIPNDLLVSIFALVQNDESASEEEKRERRRWVREVFPLVCRRWRHLYNSQSASPLHETLEIDFYTARRPVGSRRVHRAEAFLAWARRRHAGDVRVLRVVDSNCDKPGGFTSAEFATIVEVLGPHLTEIEIDERHGSLAGAPFWDVLRRVVAPAGQLRKLRVDGIVLALAEGDALDDGGGGGGGRDESDSSEGSDDEAPSDVDDVIDVSFLGQLTSLEELRLHVTAGPGYFTSAGSVDRGLSAFPGSVLSCTRLRRLELQRHCEIERLPAGVSSLQALESLDMNGCSLRSLPEELGALTRLTTVDAGKNTELSEAAEGVAFPAALRGLKKSLRRLNLRGCWLRSVPSFVGELEALEDLDLSKNWVKSRGGFPESSSAVFPALTRLDLSSNSLASVPPAVLSSMSRLRVLDLSSNRLTSLPDDLGERLPELREIYLRDNRFRLLPLRALAGATSLEVISLSSRSQIEEPLDPLVDGLPRLREIYFSPNYGQRWTPASRALFQRLKERLRSQDRSVFVKF